MSSARVSPKQSCLLGPEHLQYEHYLSEEDWQVLSATASEPYPWFTQVQANACQAIQSAIEARHFGHCWLLGPQGSGRHQAALHLLRQHFGSRLGVDQILWPDLIERGSVNWCEAPAGYGAMLCEGVENFLRDFQSHLFELAPFMNSGDTSSFAQELRVWTEEHLRHLIEQGADTPVGSYLWDVQNRLLEQASFITSSLIGQGAPPVFIDGLEQNLHIWRLRLLTRGQQSPVVSCAMPEDASLFGRVQRRHKAYVNYSDHTTITAGALICARHGAALLDGERLAAEPELWWRLRQALTHSSLDLALCGYEPGQQAHNIDSCRVPLAAKVFITITPATYQALSDLDPNLDMVVPYRAEFAEDCPRERQSELALARGWSYLCRDQYGIALQRSALEALLRFSSCQAEDKRRLSLIWQDYLPLLETIGVTVKEQGRQTATAEDVSAALRLREQRSSLTERQLHEYTMQDIIRIDTTA